MNRRVLFWVIFLVAVVTFNVLAYVLKWSWWFF